MVTPQNSDVLIWNEQKYPTGSWIVIQVGEGSKMSHAQVSFLYMLPDGNVRVVDEGKMYMHTIKPSQIVRVTRRDPSQT
jgi:hypothetical protein